MHIDRPGGFDCLQKQHGTNLLAGAQPFSQHDASAYRDRDFAANKYAKPHLHLNHGAFGNPVMLVVASVTPW